MLRSRNWAALSRNRIPLRPSTMAKKKGSAHVEESATPSVKNLKRFKENRRRSLDFCDSLDGGQFRVLVFSAVLSVRSII